ARPVAVPAVAAASRRPQSVPVAAGAADRVAGRLRPAAFANAAVTASAALAWTGGADAVLDERSLSAIQSFMRPGDVAASGAYAGSVRDGIGDALAKFPCSRMQAAFRPETGGLEIRGHVPDEGLRVEVVSMLTETVGGSIPVGGSLIVLPEPQCGVLGRVEAMGLPQSSDQTDDPLVVGREAQVATRRLEDGSPLVLALQAPDFDAHVYIDYFDGGGKVYHLLPNESATDNVFAADAPFSIGDGKLGITATIAPPFGQDLAVVFGSSHPLYEGARPLDEDADDYLAWLYARIAELARTEPGFRGEWVYQLVITGPRGAFAPG
ncbi:MAG: DUF4384 domain-containing protein, partial [Inquilinus sp.]|nr:DUF4384 domain-containing protein [Inquilinus sp.]